MYFDRIYLPLPNFTQIHSQSRPAQCFVLFITIQFSLCCLHSLGSGTFHQSVYGQPTRGHILKESKRLLSQQLSITTSPPLGTRLHALLPSPCWNLGSCIFTLVDCLNIGCQTRVGDGHRLNDKPRKYCFQSFLHLVVVYTPHLFQLSHNLRDV